MEDIKRLDRKLVLKRKVVDIYEDTMLTRDGHEVKWDFLHHVGAAGIVAVRDDGKILMVRQYRNTIDGESLEIPAGKKDSEEEKTFDCAVRELEEETGYKSDNFEFLTSMISTIGYCDEVVDVYLARDLKPSKQHLDEDEYIDVEAYTVEELKDMIFKGELRDGKSVLGILAYIVKYGGDLK